MILKEVLERNKAKLKVDYEIKPIKIATDDRPYKNIFDNSNLFVTPKLETNWRQTGDKLETKKQINNKESFFSLIGLQKNIVLYIYILCQISRDKKTEPISIINLANCCNGNIKSVKKSIYRLISKGIIYRDSFKNGRGGWTIYYLPNTIYHEIMTFQTGDKLEHIP